MNLQTIEEIWREYFTRTHPQGTSAVQEKEMKQSFYAGALTMLLLTKHAADGLDECAAVRRVGEWERELFSYHQRELQQEAAS